MKQEPSPLTEKEQAELVRMLDAYGKGLVLFLTRIVGSESVAEELMEDTFCDLFVFGRAFRGESSEKTYLYAAARNRAISYLRRAARHKELNEDDAVFTELENECIADEENRRLYRALGTLPRDYRVALYLVYFENMSYREAGAVMHRSEKQVKNLLYRGKKALRERYETEELQ